MKQLRGPKHENWPVCDPRATPPEEYGPYMALEVVSGENGYLARANGAIDGPYCSPTWPSVFGRRCEPLAGRGGGFGGWSCTRAAAVARGALLQFECLRKTRGAQAFRRRPRCRKAMRGVFGLAPLLPRAVGRAVCVFFHTSCRTGRIELVVTPFARTSGTNH
jgi:hypothetical protein